MIGDRRHRRIAVVLLVIHAALLAIFVFYRIADVNDEGFYLSAAREVASGRMIYSDFFYPQMPYLPYILSPFAGHGMTTIYMSRLATAAAAMATACLFWLLLYRVTADRRVILVLLVFYVISGLVLTWHSVAKTFGWADLFLMASFYFFVKFKAGAASFYLILAAASVALAVHVRLTVLPLAILFLAATMVGAGTKRWKNAGLAAAAMAVASIPMLVILARDSRRFIFDNFGYHLIRVPFDGYGAIVLQKLTTLARLLLNPQTIVLGVIVGTVVVLWWKNGRQDRRTLRAVLTTPRGLAGAVAVTIVIMALVPNPVHQQYFVQAVPFLLLACPAGAEYYVSSSARRRTGFFQRGWMPVFIGVYILGFFAYAAIFVGAVRAQDSHCTLSRVTQIGDYLRNIPGDDRIYAEHPIYAIAADKRIIPGTEFLGIVYRISLSDDDKRYYHLPLAADLWDMLERREASALVVLNYPEPVLADAVDANYHLDYTVDRIKVYRRN